MKNLLLSMLLFTILTFTVSSQTIYQAGDYTFKKFNGAWSEIIGENEIPMLTNKIIVQFKEGVAQRDIDLIAENYSISEIYSNSRGFYTFNISGTDFVTLITNISQEASIASLEMNHLIQLMSPTNDSYNYIEELILCGHENILWPYNNTEIYDAWALSTGNPAVTVAMLDNGLYVDHEDLNRGPDDYSNIWLNLIEKNGTSGIDDDGNGVIDDFNGWDFVDEDNNILHGIMSNTHGTRLSGIIGAKTNNEIGIYGIAGGNANEGIKLMGLRIGNGQSIESALVYEAIDYAVINGARIINMSFGDIYEHPSWHVAISYAYSENVILVASAGNYQAPSWSNTGIMYPARYEEVIAVGATVSNPDILGSIEGRWNPVGELESAEGPELELMAPGYAFVTEVSENPYQVYHSEYDFAGATCLAASPQGSTSKASAFATGVVALLVSANPCLSNDEIREILQTTTDGLGATYDQNHHSNTMGYGRLNARAALEACLSGSLTSITTNTTWNANRTLYYNVEIEDGATLIIQNCVVSASQLVKIIVKPGGKLIIDNSTITSLCNHQWQGIEVWGNSTQHQWYFSGTSYYQGYLKLDNATISNAVCAVNLWKPGDQTKTGGILLADESNFINNTQSIHALLYRNFHPVTHSEMDYQAIIDDCIFDLRSDYVGDFRFFKHVDLNGIKGVRFIGCDFILSPVAKNVDKYNHGISASDAGFSVNSICTSNVNPCPENDYDRCTFTGFDHGLSINNGGSSNTFYVNKADFDNNVIGIQINGTNNFIIIKSAFKVGNTNRTDCSYGIYMEASHGFSIEENSFTKKAGALCDNTVGIYTISTRGVDDIYRNQFSNLTTGNYCKGYNYLQDYWTGLEFLCNTNTGNYVDFYVQYLLEMGDNIQSQQGNRFLPAGNTFSPNASSHFYNGGECSVGYYFRNLPNETPDVNKVYHVTREFTTMQPADFCVSHFGTGNPKEIILLNEQEKIEQEYLFASAQIDLNNIENLYNQLIDGGSTPSIMSEIEAATPNNMISVKNDLLLSSPHLSEEVLMRVSERNEVFPNIVIFDILAANPDELKKENLLVFLEEKENPLPDYMIEILEQVATGTSYKTVLQEEMNKFNHLRTNAANAIIRSILNSEFVDYNEMRIWFENLGGIDADKQIINSYLDEKNYSAAISLAESLNTKYNLSGDELADNNAYLSCLSLYVDMKTSGRNYNELTESELTLIEEIILNNYQSANSFAKSIKTGYNNIAVCDCPQIEDTQMLKHQEIEYNKLSLDYGLTISLNPNPAKNWATFDYTLPINESRGIIEIRDLNSKLVERFNVNDSKGQIIWEASKIPAGQYLYNFISGSYNKSGKIIIVK